MPTPRVASQRVSLQRGKGRPLTYLLDVDVDEWPLGGCFEQKNGHERPLHLAGWPISACGAPTCASHRRSACLLLHRGKEKQPDASHGAMAPRRRAVALAPRHGRLRRLAPLLLENDRGDDVVHRLNLVCWGKSWGLDIWRPEPSRLLGWPGLAASCRRLCVDLERSKVGPDPGHLKNLAF